MRVEEYRTLHFTYHASKILSRRGLKKIINKNLNNNQFGCEENIGTREAVLALRLITEEKIGYFLKYSLI